MTVPSSNRVVRYLAVILRWMLIAFGVFFFTVFSGMYITDHLLTKVYTATAQIEVKLSALDVPASTTPSGKPQPLPQDFVIAQLESPDVLLPVILDLDLNRAWEIRIFNSKEDVLTDTEALAYMNQILKLDVVRGTNIINITVTSDVPEEAAQIANAIADKYKVIRDVEEDQRNSQGQESLRNQIALQQKAIEEKRLNFEELRRQLLSKYKLIPNAAEAGHPLSAEETADLQKFRDAQSDLEKQRSILDALNIRLQQVVADRQLQQSPVRIISRAEAPESPSKSNRGFAYVVTIIIASFLGIAAASFVEIVFLFTRAGERSTN